MDLVCEDGARKAGDCNLQNANRMPCKRNSDAHKHQKNADVRVNTALN